MHDFMIERYRRIDGSKPPSELPPESQLPGGEPSESLDLIDLRMLLDELESIDTRAAEVFRLRSLLGMTIEEVSDMLEIGHATVERDYRYARVWLRKKLIEADLVVHDRP
jgi:RNA polymerase sigma factor (sigma-70 family)